MIKQFNKNPQPNISSVDLSIQDALEGSCEPPRVTKQRQRTSTYLGQQSQSENLITNGAENITMKSLFTQDLSLFNQMCNSPMVYPPHGALNDSYASIPDEPTLENNSQLIAQYQFKGCHKLTKTISQSQLFQKSMKLEGISITTQSYPVLPLNFYQNLYRDIRLKFFYLQSLKNSFQQQQKNHTDLQKLQLLHFSQTLMQIKQKFQFPMPIIKIIKPKFIYLPPQVGNKTKKTLMLDLDETMVHCNEDLEQKADFHLSIQISLGFNIRAGVRIRPHLLEFMEEMSKIYEIIVFTASHRIYAEAVLNKIDPDGQLVHFLFSRESCILDKGCYIKDLRVVNGRDISQIVLVDNSTMSFIYQLENGIPIIPFYNNENDTELLSLAGFLRTLEDVPDVRQTITQYFQFQKLGNYLDPQEASDNLYIF